MPYLYKNNQYLDDMGKNKQTFKAFRVEEENGTYKGSIKQLNFNPLQEEEIRVKVRYSSLNYKDALSSVGNKGVTKNYPHTPGIDAVGVVEESTSSKWKKDDKVIVTSYDLGMNSDGGFSEYIQVPAAWAVKLPKEMCEKDAMILGTAGLTAGMLVLRLSELVKPEDGRIIVSGATGGVGGLSISILSKLGYSVIGITEKSEDLSYLQSLGAKEIITRHEIENFEKRPLLKSQFAGGIDTVGGVILENIIKSINPMGVVTCCGNVASPQLELTVFPFILRGVALIGIDSQNYPMNYRKQVWERLAKEWKLENMEKKHAEITLENVQEKIDVMLQGKSKGRVIIKMD